MRQLLGSMVFHPYHIDTILGVVWGRLLVPITRNMGRMDGWYLCLIPMSYGMMLYILWYGIIRCYTSVVFKMYSIRGYRVEILPGNVFVIP